MRRRGGVVTLFARWMQLHFSFGGVNAVLGSRGKLSIKPGLPSVRLLAVDWFGALSERKYFSCDGLG